MDMRKWIGIITLALPAVASAGGFEFSAPGTQAAQRGGAMVARADDPSALWINPAGLGKTRNWAIYVGGAFLHYDLTFQREGTYPAHETGTNPAYVGSPYPEMSSSTLKIIPSIGVAARFGKLGVGLGLFGPQGNPDRDFGCSFADGQCMVAADGRPAPQRYDIISQSALVAFPSLGASYRVHDLVDVGARVTWGFGHIKARTFTWGITNHGEDPNLDADFELDVKDAFVPTFGFGALARPMANLEVGVMYKRQATIDAKGPSTADLGSGLGLPGQPDRLEPVTPGTEACQEGGTSAILRSCVTFKTPMAVNAGARWIFRDATGGEKADVELDLTWENWSNASDINIVVDARSTTTLLTLRPVVLRHGFNDTLGVRLGGSYNIPVGLNRLQVRGGLSYDTAAAPNSWTRLDLDGTDKVIASAGGAFRFGMWTVDLGFAYGFVPSRTVTDLANPTPTYDNRTQPDPAQPLQEPTEQIHHPYNAGQYSAGYWMGNVGVTAEF